MWHENKIFWLIDFTLLTIPVLAQDDTIKEQRFFLSGYIKDLQSISYFDGANSSTSSNLIHNRLNFRANISSVLSTRLEVRNRIYFGEQITQIPDFAEYINQYNGYINLSRIWVNDQSLVVHSVIDRAVIHYTS